MDREERMKEIDKRIRMTGIIDAPGVILVGLGLYAKFGANGDPFLPILGNDLLVNVMLVVGALIMVSSGYTVLKLAREKARLVREAEMNNGLPLQQPGVSRRAQGSGP